MNSAVAMSGELQFMVTVKGIGAKVFEEFLRRLLHGWKKPIFLIVDGHPTHKAKLVQAFLERMKEKLRLFYLPPYSPELNPNEYVWNDVKNHGVGRSMITNVITLRLAVESPLTFLQKNPHRVRAFSQSQTTAYAALLCLDTYELLMSKAAPKNEALRITSPLKRAISQYFGLAQTTADGANCHWRDFGVGQTEAPRINP